MNQKILSKVSHLSDWMSSAYSPLNSHVVAIGDDVYHDHDFYEIVYVINGQIPHIVNGQHMDLVTGDMLFVRPTDKHIYLRDDGNTCTHRDIVINLHFFETTCQFLGETFLPKYRETELPKKCNLHLNEIEMLEEEIKKHQAILQTNTEQKLISAKFLLIKLLSIFYQHTAQPYNDKYPLWLNRLLEKMNMCEYYKAGLPTILSFFDYDQSYMCRVFKHYMGMTMTEYMNELKLEYVANQLKLTNRTILSICHDAGFSSMAHLNKLFKSKYGMTPKKFRNV